MQKEILSLRNIYRFLTVNDYPIYSSGILKEESKKGLTLTKFWQDILLYDFRSGYYGKQIWKTTGGRNRHISEICNRSEVLKWYTQYTEELVQSINTKTLLLQIQQFVNWLEERKYDGEVFDKKLRALLNLLAESDECFTKEMASFFLYNLEEMEKHTVAREFGAGWLLTILSIHALTGDRMQSEQMQRVRKKEEFSLVSLWKEYKCKKEEDVQSVHFLTGRNNAMCVEPLEKMHFFGREAEVFELRELLVQGGYYLISGMGGIGKTELLRQLLHICVEQKLVDEIALIQYEGNLIDSCITSFPGIFAENETGILQEAMARIRMQEGKRVLTLVDNMNKNPEEDPNLAQLLTLPGTVIVSSRLTSLEGFTTYQVETLNKEMGALVFRDHYRSPISKEDKEELSSILEQELWRHTLTLKLLGNMARNKKWTIRQLKEKLFTDGRQVLKPREDRENNLAEMYRRMYDLSALSEKQVKFLRCFAVFPYQNYSEEFMQSFMSELMGEDLQMDKLLDYGWISHGEQGYTMHPVISECILSKPPVEADVECFLCALERYWNEKCGVGEDRKLEKWYVHTLRGDDKDYSLIVLLMVMGNSLRGKYSKKFLMLLVRAGVYFISNGIGGKSAKELINCLKENQDTSLKEVEWMLNVVSVGLEYSVRKEQSEAYWQKYLVQEKNLNWQMFIYGHELAYRMIYAGELERAKSVLEYLQKYDEIPFLRILTEAALGMMYVHQTQFEKAKELFKEAVILALKYGFPNGAKLQNMCGYMTSLCSESGDMEEAKKWLEELKMLVEEKESIIGRMTFLQCKGIISRHLGQLEESIKCFKEALDISKSLVGETVEYAIGCSEMGLILHKQEKFEEAEGYYHRALNIFLSDPENFVEMQVSRMYNNWGDMYIDWKKYPKALECLTHAEKYGKSVGGIGVAEVKRNFARTYRMLGDTEKEYEYLQLAVPLLLEVYGLEHERTVAMRERLEEVEANRK